MRLRQIQVTNTPPIRQFLADQLPNTVVFAGPNGAGKTRLVGALPQFFQNPMAGIGPNGAVESVGFTAALTTSTHFRHLVGNISIMSKECFGKTIGQLQTMLTAKLE
jgi:hypothetical protein